MLPGNYPSYMFSKNILSRAKDSLRPSRASIKGVLIHISMMLRVAAIPTEFAYFIHRVCQN